nr:hypothetical protein [uncultured Draconibacterium sp.]
MSKISKTIWNPSIRNNVIATVIVAVIGFVCTSIWSYITAVLNKTNFKTEFKNLWNIEIKLWVIVLTIIGFLILILVLKRLVTRKFKYNEETLDVDRKTFNKIRTEVFPSETRSALTGIHFHTDFKEDRRICLDTIDTLKNADYHFFNPKLENLKRDIIPHLDELKNYMFKSEYVDEIRVKERGGATDDEYFMTLKMIRGAGEKSFNQIDLFIKEGRKILKV